MRWLDSSEVNSIVKEVIRAIAYLIMFSVLAANIILLGG